MADQRAFLVTAMKYPAEGEKRDVEQTQQIVDCMRAVHLCAFTVTTATWSSGLTQVARATRDAPSEWSRRSVMALRTRSSA